MACELSQVGGAPALKEQPRPLPRSLRRWAWYESASESTLAAPRPRSCQQGTCVVPPSGLGAEQAYLGRQLGMDGEAGPWRNSRSFIGRWAVSSGPSSSLLAGLARTFSEAQHQAPMSGRHRGPAIQAQAGAHPPLMVPPDLQREPYCCLLGSSCCVLTRIHGIEGGILCCSKHRKNGLPVGQRTRVPRDWASQEQELPLWFPLLTADH